VCQRCTARSLTCSYAKEEQKQRDQAMKARLETLEQLFSTLQSQSPDEAHRTVQSIRSSSVGISSSTPSSSTQQTQQPQGSSLASGDETTGAGSTASRAHQVGQQPGCKAGHFGLPDAAVVNEAVTIFYDSSGPLFHVFTRAQALALCAGIYDPARAHDISDSMRADVACVAAIASVGAQYMNGGIDGDLDSRLYEISRGSFEAVIEERPLDAIKISALLAMFNIMTKATTAITYVGMSNHLSVGCPSQRTGLD
jgi:hypothetical protein